MEMAQINSLCKKKANEAVVAAATRAWVKEFVIELNLCPFAGRFFIENSIRYEVCSSDNEEYLLESLFNEIKLLRTQDQIATTVLIHPNTHNDFAEYNQFLDAVDRLLEVSGCVGEFQVASFHPDYQFANTEVADVENFTNRSPFPMLHILREQLVTDAVNNYKDIHDISTANIRQLRKIGSAQLASQLKILQSSLIDK